MDRDAEEAAIVQLEILCGRSPVIGAVLHVWDPRHGAKTLFSPAAAPRSELPSEVDSETALNPQDSTSAYDVQPTELDKVR